VRFAGNVPPTPHFARHIERIFIPFCRDAIQSFLVVGFAPYRIRTLRDGCMVPEVLPLGTFSWNVTRDNSLIPKAWFFDRHRQQMGVMMTKPKRAMHDDSGRDAGSKRARTGTNDDEVNHNSGGGDGPLLSYDVTTSFTDEAPFVYPFTAPSTLFPCTSFLATLVQSYTMLCHKRGCMLRAEQFNSKPTLVFEEQNKIDTNRAANTASNIQDNTAAEQDNATKERQYNMGMRQNLHYATFAEARLKSQLPEEAVTLIAPINHNVHSLDKAISPQDLHREELGFMRLVAVSMGLPPALLLQGSAVIGTAAVSTSASTLGWADSAEISNRQIIETCNHLNGHVQLLLEVCVFGVCLILFCVN
jgi:hypothetical protein